MPILNFRTTETLNPERRQSIANSLTELTARLLHKDPSLTAVIVSEVKSSDWFIGGQTLGESGANSFNLEIAVTSQTNTKSEMAEFIRSVFEVMHRLLGSLHETSYIIIHEIPAVAWGFGGKTQEFRFIARQIESAV